jgi:hypothetical protein
MDQAAKKTDLGGTDIDLPENIDLQHSFHLLKTEGYKIEGIHATAIRGSH